MSHRYLVLGLLAEAPMTGYEIKKRIGKTLKSVTSVSYGTLYPILHRLLDEGAVQMEEQVQAHRPVRKVYQITERGQQELAEWLQQPPGADQIRREFLLKLYLARDLPPDTIQQFLRQRRAATLAHLNELQQTQDSLNGNMPLTQHWVNDYTIAMCQAELQWLNRLMAQIEANLAEHNVISEHLVSATPAQR